MKVVLDVNILASASVFRDRTPWRITEAGFRGEFQVFLSDEMLATLGVVLERPYFAARLSAEERERFLLDLRRGTSPKSPDPAVRGIAPDAEDDLVLGTAVAAGAEFLVTGDKELLAIGHYGNTQIVTAEEFLAYLEGLT